MTTYTDFYDDGMDDGYEFREPTADELRALNEQIAASLSSPLTEYGDDDFTHEYDIFDTDLDQYDPWDYEHGHGRWDESFDDLGECE